jgi:hypothetical protein
MTARIYDLKRLSHLHRYINKYVFNEPNAEEIEMLSEYEYLKAKYPNWKQEREVTHHSKTSPKPKVRKKQVVKKGIGMPDGIIKHLNKTQ